MMITRQTKQIWHKITSSVQTRVLLASLAVVAGLMGFFAIADEINEEEIHAMDKMVMDTMRVEGNPGKPIGHPRITMAFDDFTALGGFAVLSFITIFVCLYLLLNGRGWCSLLTFLTITGGSAMSALLKYLYNRPRPDPGYQLVEVSMQSFPSGHAMIATVVYMTLGVILAHQVRLVRQKIFLIVTALLVSALVGISRVWLGVHYPTDVMAGWAAGLAWALACHLLAWWLESLADREGETLC
ncbi:MAG: phosphatase PAP2 family protein [Phycisphaerae bacterium]